MSRLMCVCAPAGIPSLWRQLMCTPASHRADEPQSKIDGRVHLHAPLVHLSPAYYNGPFPREPFRAWGRRRGRKSWIETGVSHNTNEAFSSIQVKKSPDAAPVPVGSQEKLCNATPKDLIPNNCSNCKCMCVYCLNHTLWKMALNSNLAMMSPPALAWCATYCRTLPFPLFIIIYSAHQPGRHVFVKKKKKCRELLFPVSRNQQTNQINPISYWSNSLRLPVCEGRHQLQLNAPWRVAARHHCVTKLLSRTIAVESEDIFPTERSLLCRSFTRF